MRRIVELFAGAGGATLGIRRALGLNFKHIAFDSDPHAAAVWREAHGGEHAAMMCRPIDSFIEEMRSPTSGGVPAAFRLPMFGTVELLWSSPPCQMHSRAGNGQGYDGWPATLWALDVYQPDMVVIENVDGAPWDVWRRDVGLRGYGVAVWRLDAQHFGVPQKRVRNFLVGVRSCPSVALARPPAATHPISTTIREALEMPPDVYAVGGGSNPRYAGDKRTERDLSDGPSTTVCSDAGNQRPRITARTGWESNEERDLDAPSRTVLARGNNVLALGQPWYHPRDPDAGSSSYYVPGQGRACTRPELLDRPSCTDTTTDVRGTRASASSGYTFHGGPDRVSDQLFLACGRRRATPFECARLQGFPDDYPWGTRAKQHRYRLIGNAVPPMLAEVVVTRLKEVRDELDVGGRSAT